MSLKNSGAARPLKHTTWLNIAYELAQQSTCVRRKVGCVLLDVHSQVLSTGWNGVGAGMEHCIDSPCPGAGYASGTGHEKCEAIHAEQNALVQCKDHKAIFTCYTTTAPCMFCTKMLLNTGCRHIVFCEDYIHTEAEQLWLMSKPEQKSWQQFTTGVHKV